MKKVAVTILILIMFIPTIAFAMSGDRVSLGYIYNLSSSHTKIVNNSNGNINTVSPTCLDLSNDGHLVINNIFSQNFVNNMHDQNILVTPFLSNHWGKVKGHSALVNREELADEILNAVNTYNLDGVNIDLENLDPSDKDNLTDFMRILREKLPKEKVLSIAVASNIYRLTTTWVAAYDYANLAKYADYLVLMAYDEHSAGGAPGPVASINFVENSVKVMLEDISRDKIVLGMPLYGRLWKETNTESGDEEILAGEAIVMSQAEVIARRYQKYMPIYNEYTGTVNLKIEVESGDKKAMVNGRYLDAGVYDIYYENETSFNKKLEVMNKYGLKGAALWAIGNEGNNFWNYYEKGFKNENYESEKSILQRRYYEEVERIMKDVRPLKLDKSLKFDDKLKEGLEKKQITDLDLFFPEPDDKVHLPDEERFEVEEPLKTNEIVVTKEKHYKKIDVITLIHIIKRISK